MTNFCQWPLRTVTIVTALQEPIPSNPAWSPYFPHHFILLLWLVVIGNAASSTDVCKRLWFLYACWFLCAALEKIKRPLHCFPDLNPIENHWNVIKRKTDGHKPLNKADLVTFLHQESVKVKWKIVEVMKAETDNPCTVRTSECLNALKGSFLCWIGEKCCLSTKKPQNTITNLWTGKQVVSASFSRCTIS